MRVTTQRIVSGVVLLLLGAVSGCAAPSLLITPVSGRRDLVESQIARDAAFTFNKIAVIDVSGVILNSPKPQLLGEGEHPVSYLLEQLDKARCDSSVKAVLLRINSPGGSDVASELMYDEIQYYRACTGKPVVAVMMDVAASGGYYIACACDEIIAQPSTVTGSIGVIMQMFDVTGTMDKIGLRTDAITSGPRKDSGSPLRPMRPEERAHFQTMVNDMYDRFVQVVVSGRPNLNEETVRRLADGRVYTAQQALDAGLIDRTAGMRGAIERTKELAGISRARVVTYHRATDYKPNYYAAAPRGPAGDVNLLKLDADSFFDRTPRFMYLWSPGE